MLTPKGGLPMRGIFILLCLLFMMPFPAPSLSHTGFAPEGTWYIRIIARDDSPAAQEEKLFLRDRLLPLFPENPRALPAYFSSIRSAARQLAPCEAEIRFWTPDEKTLPAPTVYITIGEGGGKNWWGMLYPQAPEMARTPESREEAEIKIIWPIWEWMKSLLKNGFIPRAQSIAGL